MTLRLGRAVRHLVMLAVLATAALVALSAVAFADAQVTITDDGIEPESVTVDVRESIVWTNATDRTVSLTARDTSWTSGSIRPGASFSTRLTGKGTHRYASGDGSLEGEIVVGAAGGGGAGDAGGDPAKDRVGPDDEALPETGGEVAVPGALTVLLIAVGMTLLVVTDPRRALRG